VSSPFAWFSRNAFCSSKHRRRAFSLTPAGNVERISILAKDLRNKMNRRQFLWAAAAGELACGR
jgi:hypothetical protein